MTNRDFDNHRWFRFGADRFPRALDGLPRLAQAFERGEISFSLLSRLTHVVKPDPKAALRPRCHGLVHRDLLTITGDPARGLEWKVACEDLTRSVREEFEVKAPSAGSDSKVSFDPELSTIAIQALVKLGWSEKRATDFLLRALEHFDCAGRHAEASMVLGGAGDRQPCEVETKKARPRSGSRPMERGLGALSSLSGRRAGAALNSRDPERPSPLSPTRAVTPSQSSGARRGYFKWAAGVLFQESASTPASRKLVDSASVFCLVHARRGNEE